jgi:hypothetical protein
MGRDKEFPLTEEMEVNLSKLMVALVKFQAACPEELVVTSGYRPAKINASVPGAAKHSHHMECLACDFHDPDGKIDQFCADNFALLEECGLYMESPRTTPGWCHLQAISPKSGHRMFLP